jgi:hypothetical protein
VNCTAAARSRLDHADCLATVLDAAHAGFETILAVLRGHQDRAGHAFPAFVLAAGAAANGRDWIADAPALPPAETTPCQSGDEPPRDHDWRQAAVEVADLSQAPAIRLTTVAAASGSPQDRTACEHAAAYAGRIHALLSGAPPS